MNVYPTQPGRLDFSAACHSQNPALHPMRQGDTFRRTLGIEPLDLTDHDMRMSVRAAPDDENPLLFLSTGNGRIEVIPDAFSLIVAAEDTEELPAGVYKYDIELVTPGGEVYTLLEGRFDIVREITQEAD